MAVSARNDAFECDLGMRPAEDEMRMLVVGREESVAAGLDGRVAGLHNLLKNRQIRADKHVGIRCLVGPNLRKSSVVHRRLLVKMAETESGFILHANSGPGHTHAAKFAHSDCKEQGLK